MDDLLDFLGECMEDFDADDNALEPGMAYLFDLEPGRKFCVGNETVGTEKFVLLEKLDNCTARVVRESFLTDRMIFGDSSDWRHSHIRDSLNGRYYERLASMVGSENIIGMERDLTSLDGLDDYGTCVDDISMMTVAEYAKYHKILGVNERYPYWQYLITPYSTPINGYTRSVCCVNYGGAVRWDGCGFGSCVRPFCTFNSSILVKVEEDE